MLKIRKEWTLSAKSKLLKRKFELEEAHGRCG